MLHKHQSSHYLQAGIPIQHEILRSHSSPHCVVWDTSPVIIHKKVFPSSMRYWDIILPIIVLYGNQPSHSQPGKDLIHGIIMWLWLSKNALQFSNQPLEFNLKYFECFNSMSDSTQLITTFTIAFFFNYDLVNLSIHTEQKHWWSLNPNPGNTGWMLFQIGHSAFCASCSSNIH